MEYGILWYRVLGDFGAKGSNVVFYMERLMIPIYRGVIILSVCTNRVYHGCFAFTSSTFKLSWRYHLFIWLSSIATTIILVSPNSTANAGMEYIM